MLNDGRDITEFGLTDGDLDEARRKVEQLPQSQQTIRQYLEIVRDKWEERTGYIREVAQRIPLATEIWIVVCYPEAETKVAAFSTKSTGIVEDNWRVNFSKLREYLKNTQKAAKWPDNRLALALVALHTKTLYLPTNSFVNAVAAYGPDVKDFPVSRETFEEWGQQENWFQKSKAKITLARSPLMRQLLSLEPTTGERRKGRNVASFRCETHGQGTIAE